MRIKALLVSAVVVGLLAIAFQGISPSTARAVSVVVSQTPGEAPSLPPTTAAGIQPAAAISAWTLLGTQSPPRDGHGFVYDSKAGVFVLFGGAVSTTTFTNSTWTYNASTSTWTNVTPVVGPSPRAGAGVVYDSKADRVILFGGTTAPNVYSSETWSFDLASDTWTLMNPSPAPAGRVIPAIAYDAYADRTVLYGGSELTGLAGDTWTYSYSANTWSPVNVTSPGALGFAAMTYVASAHRDILFGGASLSGFNFVFHFETRAFDATNGTWTLLTPVDHPSARGAFAFSYDSASDHAVLFGGTTSLTSASGVQNDTWVYSYSQDAWTNVTPASGPSGRLLSAMDFDPVTNRTILFGGAPITGVPHNDTWAFAYAAGLPGAPRNLVGAGGAGRVTLTWQAPLSDGGSPVTNYTIYRATASGAETLLVTVGKVLTYDDLAVTPGTTYYYEVAAVTAAGEGPKSNEASATPLGPAVPPSAPQNLAATGGNAQVVLTWQAPASDGGSPITAYNVYRGTTSGGETLLTSLGVVLTYTDAAVTNGVTYYYEVSAVNGAGEGPQSNEVSAMPATVPSAPAALVATGGTQQVVITWGAPASNGGVAVTGYRIYRGTTAGAETLLTSVGTGQTYTDSAVQIGQTYYYEVSAVNGVGEGPKSNEAYAVPHAAPDTTQPVILIQTPANGSVLSSTRVTVSGTSSDNVQVQKVEVSTDGTTWVVATGTTSWSANLTLAEGTDTIYARATDTSGNTRTVTITVTVQAAGPGTQGIDPLVLAGIAIVIIAAAIALLLFVLRRRKKAAPPPPPP